MKAIVELFTQAHKSLVFLEKTIVILLLFTMITLSFGQVLARNFFSSGFMWIDEVLRLQVLWLTFLGAGLAAEYNRHVKIDVLSHIFGGGGTGKVIDILAQIFAGVVSAFLFIAAVHYIQVEAQYPSYELVRNVPDWAFRLVIPYFFCVMSVRCLVNIRRVIMGTHSRSIEP